MPAERSNVSSHRRARNRSRAPWAIIPRLAAKSAAPCPAKSNNTDFNAPAGAESPKPTFRFQATSATPSLSGSAVNSNSNWNKLTGIGNIMNHSSNVNLQSSTGAFLHYGPINYFKAPAPKESDMIQTRIAAALKERHVPTAAYDAQLGKGCMDGTRVQVLQEIEDWILDPKAKPIFWLSGMMGTGKSAIAQTVCFRVRAHSRVVLGGSFFCSRSVGSISQRDVRYVVPTLAQLLARQSSEFSQALAEELARDPDILHKQVTVQVKQLLYAPLLALRDSNVPIVFVIDALDECSDQALGSEVLKEAGSHHIVSEMLEALVDFSRSSVQLPVKFLVTSRPETHIRDTPVSDLTFSTVLHLHTVNKEQVTTDIRLYISTRLSSNPKLRARFTDDDAEMLSLLCDGLFIIATTALQYTFGAGNDGAASRFRTLLNSTRDCLSSESATSLDRMYHLILVDAVKVGEIETDELRGTLQLLATLLASRMALSIAALADLLAVNKDEVRARLSRLHAVVHVPDDDDDPSLRTLHASFGDYLLGRAPSSIRISESLGHDVLARGCLRVIAERLHFNVSNSCSSYDENPSTRCNAITFTLEYACQQWIYHISGLPEVAAFDEDIQSIFFPRFLFWLEVMSILGKVRRAAAMLVFAAATVHSISLAQFLRDANAFVASSREAIERSASHIYVSGLPFASKDSLVYKTFFPLCTGLISVETFGIGQHGGRLVMTLPGHQRGVNSVSYSADGHLIASGSHDGTIQIWDTRTGEYMMSPLCSNDGAVWSVAFSPAGKSLAAGTGGGTVCVWSILVKQATLRRLMGHSGTVLSVSFSPDRLRLASASADKTIRLWQAETGHQLALLKGHTGVVCAVVFSPSGVTLASCSDDRSIRLWHVATGQPAGQPLQGHGNAFLSIGFSPDGTKMVSSDTGKNIQLWDFQTRSIISTLRGHSGWVRCVRFCPNGKSLVSASDDHSIRLWSISRDTWEMSSIAFDGHTDFVRSISLSPDGFHIASASEDRTVRIWDATDTQQPVQPLQAPQCRIRSLIVSSDGTCIVSGAEDCLVRVWDTKTGDPRLPPLIGHTRYVYSVAISSNGRFIASGSADHTVRLWNAQTGEAVGDSLKSHRNVVRAVMFSPCGKWLASGSEDRTVRLWNVTTEIPSEFDLLRCSNAVHTVTFSPDGQTLAAGGMNGHIHLWMAFRSQPVSESRHATDSHIRCICYSPDGTRIASGGDDKMIRVWNVSTGEQLIAFEGHTGAVRSVAFSSDGQIICSGSIDQTLRLWNASTGFTIATLRGHKNWLRSIAFTPDGQSIVSCSDDETIRIWDLKSACVPSSRSSSEPSTALSSAILENGWVVGSSGELLLWVPTQYREHLQVLPCTMLISRSRISAMIGNSGWHRGKAWTLCWRNDTPITVLL